MEFEENDNKEEKISIQKLFKIKKHICKGIDVTSKGDHLVAIAGKILFVFDITSRKLLKS